MNQWQKYYDDTKNNPPSKLLVEASEFVRNKSDALDMGSGALVDSKYLLSQGFKVVAMDASEAPEKISNSKFKFIQSSFQDFIFPKEEFDLVNAQFALPFNGKEGFDELWENIIDTLRPAGLFVGQLFGINDEWSKTKPELVLHNREQVEQLLSGLEIIKLQEIERDGKLADGTPKHWHLFNIIARKR